MSIYDIDFSIQSENLLPPDKRLPKWKSFIKEITSVIQLLRDRFFDDYADSSTAAFWVSAATYAYKDEVIGTDNAVYELITEAGITGITTPPHLDPTNWTKIQDVYIGVRERLKYNSQKILFEYILNKWFRVAIAPADQIYIVNNPLDLNGFVVGEFEDTSSSIAQTESFQQGYLGNSYSFGSYSFTIWVPIAIFNALAATNPERENIIRAQADKYVYAGFMYNVITY